MRNFLVFWFLGSPGAISKITAVAIRTRRPSQLSSIDRIEMKRPVSRINLAFPTLRAPSFEPSTSRHCFLFLFFFFASKKAAPNQFRDSRKILLDFTRDSKRKLRSINFYLRHVTLRREYFSPIFLGENGRPPIYRGARWSVNANAQLPISDSTTSLFLSEIPPIWSRTKIDAW